MECASRPRRNVPGIANSSPEARIEIYDRSGFVLYGNKNKRGIQKHAADYWGLNWSFKMLVWTTAGLRCV